VRQAIAAHLDSRQVSRVLHGSIIGLALVVALEAHPPSAGVVAATLVATAIAFGLSELYSDVVGTETRTHARVEGEQLRDILDEAAAVAVGCAFPAIFFVLAALGVMKTGTAFDVAKWSGFGLIVAYGYAAARMTGVRGFAAVRRAGLAGLIAVFLILIKALLH
jgi:hypothetical protein